MDTWCRTLSAQGNVFGFVYVKELLPKFAGLVKKCQQSTSGDPTKFELFLQIAQDGEAQDAWPTKMVPAVNCLMFELRRSHEAKEILFPVPPAPDYWLKFDMDTAMFITAK